MMQQSSSSDETNSIIDARRDGVSISVFDKFPGILMRKSNVKWADISLKVQLNQEREVSTCEEAFKHDGY